MVPPGPIPPPSFDVLFAFEPDVAVGFSVGRDGNDEIGGVPLTDELRGGAGGEVGVGEDDEGTEGGGGEDVEPGGGGEIFGGGTAGGEPDGEEGVSLGGGGGDFSVGFATGGGGESEEGGDGTSVGGGGEATEGGGGGGKFLMEVEVGVNWQQEAVIEAEMVGEREVEMVGEREVVMLEGMEEVKPLGVVKAVVMVEGPKELPVEEIGEVGLSWTGTKEPVCQNFDRAELWEGMWWLKNLKEKGKGVLVG
ncbi:leucine-rich repeat (LRR) family protein [Actinidia rufa]|uniref:Leucine-rich repeat (LRR) family protein n=1 Tax=Actinidia rufa TaxID=165716 RepID=A0A7J0H799_9ERIC|nr:leucine-rich repeat (LRR) family protein [Actinidia rufa]